MAGLLNFADEQGHWRSLAELGSTTRSMGNWLFRQSTRRTSVSRSTSTRADDAGRRRCGLSPVRAPTRLPHSKGLNQVRQSDGVSGFARKLG